MAMSEFGKAFNAARKRGDLKFKFKGKDGATKEYTTNLKGENRRAMYDSPADTAKFRAERDKPRTKVGQTGTRNFSSDSSDSAPEDGTRKALQDLSARTSPRELGKIPPRRYSAEESKNMASREAGKEGSLTNQYRKESRMKDLEATGTMMATVAGAPTAVGAFEGMTAKELLKGAAGTIPGKVVTPTKEMGEKLSRRASDIYNAASTRGYKKGGKVGKVMGEFNSGALKSSSGQKVTNRKQAMAIAMSEAGKSKMKKFAAGGKTDKRSFASGDVFSNYNVGADPFLKSRKGGTFTDKEMKDGLTKEEIMRKTTPKEMPKAKKYAAGGKVGESKEMVKKEMAFMRKKGAPKFMMKHEKEEAKGMKKMAKGGMSCMKRGGGVEVKGYKKGGSIDGCAQRGKTRGKFV